MREGEREGGSGRVREGGSGRVREGGSEDGGCTATHLHPLTVAG